MLHAKFILASAQLDADGGSVERSLKVGSVAGAT